MPSDTTQAESTVLATGRRLGWMDTVRGTAILLLLLWHASAIPAFFETPMPDLIRSANAFFFPYRMPTLMLLSGMLLTRSLRKPLPAYYAGKIAMVLWPYLVWLIIAKIVFLDMPGVPWWHWHAWYAASYLWFLFFIGVYYAAAPLLKRLPSWVPIALGAVAGAFLEQGSTEQRMGYFAIFFFAGSWIANTSGLVDRLARPRAALLLAIPAIAFGAASVIWTESLQFLVWGAPLSIAGALVLIAAFARPRIDGPITRGLQFLGRSSIVFYVSHFPIMALLSQSSLAEGSFLLLATLNLAASVLLGSVLAVWKSAPPAIWLFQAPRWITATSTKVVSMITIRGEISTAQVGARTSQSTRSSE
ncbi:acyltransferase [Brachybacterium paraconglomeratum]|uniref:acyltransferase n=1 Tax=Brachybacterium paraconglomeratum TaxID=173362 RepID=UPI0031E76B71